MFTARYPIGLMVALLLALGTLVTPKVWAQQEQQSDEFSKLYDRWRQTKDPEEKIELGERMLALEPTLASWQLKISRQLTKGRLLSGVASGYHVRKRGQRPENLEKAIGHYEAALNIYSQEALHKDWAWVCHSLGLAYAVRIKGNAAVNVETAIEQYEAALTVYSPEATPNEWASVQKDLGTAFWGRHRGERDNNLEKAITHYEAALTVHTREAFPKEWAGLQHSLAATYGMRVHGDRADNLDKAIEHAKAALAVRTREALPREWSDTQHNIGQVYEIRRRGERADNLDMAIAHYGMALEVLTRDTAPEQWANAKINLGRIYGSRINGKRAENLDRSAHHYNEALTVYRRETHPYQWARAHHSLGNNYARRQHGRADAMETAIANFESALTVINRDVNLLEWAEIQRDLGLAYRGRVRGEIADNLDKAVAHAEAALSAVTREHAPIQWARTQNALGWIYWRRINGDQVENKEKAIAYHQAALSVFTRQDYPEEWSNTHNRLAGAYTWRGRGDPAENLEQQIAHYEAVLSLPSNRETSPGAWANTQRSLGAAYRQRLRGDRVDNLKKGMAHLEAALTVDQRETNPLSHLLAARALGRALLDEKEWRRAMAAYAIAREVFLSLFGDGLVDADVSELVADAQVGDLFAEAAFVARVGENETALELAGEGRALLLTAALKLHALALPAEKRRLFEELRAGIRVEQQAVQDAEAADRPDALEKLMASRFEPQALVKSAQAAGGVPRGALERAAAVVADGGAVVVPVTASEGTKLLVVTAAANGQSITVVDIPDLTIERMYVLLQGSRDRTKLAGWLGAYNINYLSANEQTSRWSEWLMAISDLGPELWQLLGARLDVALKERGLKPGARLVWLPTSLLGAFPLGLAQDPVSKRRLSDDYEIFYAPSLEALTAAQDLISKTPSPTLAAIVNPTGDLPGTEKEASIVASHFGGDARTVLEQSAATPEAVLAGLKGKTHWHFASHGTFSWKDARQSALVLHKSEPLSVERLLSTDGLGRPRLVVLSACETGLYEIRRNYDQFTGLPGAFMALGAAGVVGTLWPVSDTATALLIAKFYELHMSAGQSPPTALRHAQAWLREATSDDFLTYAKNAALRGRMQARHLAEIEQELSENGLRRSRNNAVVEWSQRGAKPRASKDQSARSRAVAQPYVHPYFWAGFIYTGL